MNDNHWTSSTITSADGTTIAYQTLGSGADLIVIGGVLSTTRDYIDLGHELAGSLTVHLMERRGRGASGPQDPGVLRAGIRGRQWQRTEVLLEANLAEQQARLDAAGIAGYAEIESQTLLIGGSASPPSVATQLQALRRTIPDTTVTTLAGLDHPAPVTHPTQVANCVEQFFAHTPSKRSADALDAARRPPGHAATRG